MADGNVLNFPAITATDFERACLQLLKTSKPHLGHSAWITVTFSGGELCIEQSPRTIIPLQDDLNVNLVDDDQDELLEDLDQVCESHLT